MTADPSTWAHGLPPHGFWVRWRGEHVTIIGWSGHLGWLGAGMALLVLGLCGTSLGLIARRSGLLFPTVTAMLACLAGAYDDLRAGRGGWHLLLGLALCPPLVVLWRWLAGAGLLALFTSMQISANHVQITYYTMLLLGIYGIGELVVAIRNKSLANWGKAALLSAAALMVGIACNLSKVWPTYEYGQETIRDAVKAGVSAYIVDGLDPKRIKPIVEVARARFEDTQALRRELDEISQKLSDRKLVDKAKGVLMKARGLDEDAAYHAMRKLAMERGQSMAKVARDVIDMARVLL